MRHSVASDTVAHLWAHELQDEAHEKGAGHFYFHGESIYSYGSHYEVARIVRNKKGQRAYIVNNHGYSSCTAKHIWKTVRAIPRGELIFYAWDCGRYYWNSASWPTTDNVVAFTRWVGEIIKHVKIFHGARVYYIKEGTEMRQMREWIKFWGLKKTYTDKVIKVAVDGTDLKDKEKKKAIVKILSDMVHSELLYGEAVLASIYDTIYGQGKYAIKYAKIKAVRDAQEAERLRSYETRKLEDLERLGKWHNHETNSWYPSCGFETEHGWYSALRVSSHKDLVETNQGIRVGLEEGERMWNLFKFYHNHPGASVSVDLCKCINGSYRLHSYKNDVFQIGCHRIPYSEAENVAKALGWA